MKNLDSLMQHIATTWKCDAARYPELSGKSVDERRNFLVKHSLLHIAKTTGKIADVCEDFDHRGAYASQAEEVQKQYAVKLFVNALKLAEEAGLSADDLLQRAPALVR